MRELAKELVLLVVREMKGIDGEESFVAPKTDKHREKAERDGEEDKERRAFLVSGICLVVMRHG